MIWLPGCGGKGRLLVLEGEFASTLRVMGRDGNTLSAVIRNAWDSGNLRILSKNTLLLNLEKILMGIM
jgi:hypothetical protein